MPAISHASDEFWQAFHRLSADVQRQADKQFALFRKDPSHPSLNLKPVGDFWAVRVTQSFRALALRDGQSFYWFWIGGHDEYERLIKG